MEPTEKSKATDPILSLGAKTNVRVSQNEICILNDYGFNFSSGFLMFSSITSRGIKYTSRSSKSVSTIDYFARFRDHEIGAIKFYFLDKCDVYGFVEIYKVIQSVDHLMEIQCTDINMVFNINEITEKVIYIAIGKRETVTAIPNKFEKT